MPQVPVDLKDFIEWLGNPLIIGVLVSILLERWSGFQNLEADQKRVISFSITFGLGVATFVLRTYTPQLWIDTLAPFFNAGMLAVLPFIAGELFHKLTTPKTDPGLVVDFTPEK